MKTEELTRHFTKNNVRYAFHKKHGWMLYHVDSVCPGLSGWIPSGYPK